MNEITKEIGQRIYLARVMRGYTREVLGEKADISPKFLYEIEVGNKGISAYTLYKLCKALEVDCNVILTGRKLISDDNRLMKIIQTFNEEQLNQISSILDDISELLNNKK